MSSCVILIMWMGDLLLIYLTFHGVVEFHQRSVGKGEVMTTQTEFELQIFNPRLNEGLYLAQALLHPETQEVMYQRNELLTVHVLVDLLTVGYEFIPVMEVSDGQG